MDSSFTWELHEVLRGVIDTENHDQVVAVMNLLVYLDQDEKYHFLVNLSDLLRAESKAKHLFFETLENIEKEIPYFSSVFAKLPVLDNLKSTTITQLLYKLNHYAQKNEIESLFNKGLKEWNLSLGARGGESWTPSIINNLAISILNPTKGTFYDSTFGYGGSIVKANDHAKSQDGQLSLYGQEINEKLWAIAKIRLFIMGYTDNDLRLGNVLIEPQFIENNQLKKFDYVFMDAPFSMKIDFYDQLQQDPYHQFFYGLPNRSNADFAFISHALASLKDTGRAIVLTPHGTLFRGGREKEIRQNMIMADVIEAVIALPAGLYHHTGIPVSMLVLNKNKQHQNKILFVDASKYITEKSRTYKLLQEQAIQKITEITQTSEEISEVSKLVAVQDLEDSQLTVNRYVLPKKLTIEGYGRVHFNIDTYETSQTFHLKDKAEFFRGYNVGSQSEEHEDGEFKIIRLSDVDHGEIKLDQVARYNILTKARTSMYELNKDDVILSIRGQTLKVAVIPEQKNDLLLSQNFIGIRCQKDLDPYFLKMFLESPLGQYLLTNRMSGTAIPTLSRRDIEQLRIPTLPLKEQQALVKHYFTKEQELKKEIERLNRELKREKLLAYEKMGLKGTFIIENGI